MCFIEKVTSSIIIVWIKTVFVSFFDLVLFESFLTILFVEENIFKKLLFMQSHILIFLGKRLRKYIKTLFIK